jgi:hypothetical protein
MTRTELLREYGIVDSQDLRVRPVQEADILWLVGINGAGDPVQAIPAMRAVELSARLRGIGEEELAGEITAAAQKAQRSNAAGAR